MFAVLGANGHLGQRLLPELAQRGGVRALVRSEAAARAVRALELGEACEVRVVDPLSADSVAAAIEGVSSVAHLAGILKETRNNRYRDAHEGPCEALAAAAHTAGVQRLVYLSILGSAPGSGNACLASRAAAEQILLAGPVPATVIRVPMVLGEGDYAAVALGRRARRAVNVVLRGASLEQPIYAGDVAAALSNAMQAAGAEVTGDRVLDLAGPESLARTALIHRAATVLGRTTRVVSLPLGVGLAAAWVLERTSANPPVTVAMLRVLDHDDRINSAPAASALGLRLTALDETLRRTLG
jgi:uncharacterized protein YbjT (DUF2867 family)